jgi:hypothetical protein
MLKPTKKPSLFKIRNSVFIINFLIELTQPKYLVELLTLLFT